MNVFQKIWTEIKFQWQVDCVYITINKEQRHNLSELKSQVIKAIDALISAKKQQKFAKQQKYQQCVKSCDSCDADEFYCADCQEFGKQRKYSQKCPYDLECKTKKSICLVPDKKVTANAEVIAAKEKYNAAVADYVNYKTNSNNR